MTLDDKEWKAVKFKEIFDEIYIAKSTDLVNIKEGNVPFVGRSSTNNGFQGEFDIDLGKINKKKFNYNWNGWRAKSFLSEI